MHKTYTKPVPLTNASTMHQTCTNNLSQQPVQTTYHNNLSHKYYQPNQIYSPRSITKTTIKDVHQPTITQQLIITTKNNMCF
jgi:hypothetical protein